MFDVKYFVYSCKVRVLKLLLNSHLFPFLDNDVMTSPKRGNIVSLVLTRLCFSNLFFMKTILVDENNVKLIIFCRNKKQFKTSKGKTWSRGTNSLLP